MQSALSGQRTPNRGALIWSAATWRRFDVQSATYVAHIHITQFLGLFFPVIYVVSGDSVLSIV